MCDAVPILFSLSHPQPPLSSLIRLHSRGVTTRHVYYNRYPTGGTMNYVEWKIGPNGTRYDFFTDGTTLYDHGRERRDRDRERE